MQEQAQLVALPLPTLQDASHRFRYGWHLDVHVRAHEAHWISPAGDRLAIPFDEAQAMVEILGQHLDAMYAPGHAYYVIAEATVQVA